MSIKNPNHIYFIGGAPCSGKSTVVEALASQMGIEPYHADDRMNDHFSRVTPDDHPHLYSWISSTWDDRWMQPLETLLEEAIGCYTEHLSIIMQELSTLQGPLFAEGNPFMPDPMLEILGSPVRNRAIWLIPSESFLRERYAARPFINLILRECADPEAAFNNWMDRDAAFAEWVRGRAESHGLPVFIIDGSQTIDETVEHIAEHFGLRLTEEA
jgi:2-phosphoglycerate kinase